MTTRSPTNKLAAGLVALSLLALPNWAAASEPGREDAATRRPMDLDDVERKKEGRLSRFSGLEITGTAIVGVGVVLCAVGVGYVVDGNKARQDLNDAIASGDPDARVQPLEDIARANQTSTIMFASCGGAVVLGSILYFTGRALRKRKNTNRVAASVPLPGATPGGASVNWSLRF